MIREHQKIPGHYHLSEMISIFTSKHKEQTFFSLNLVKENAATIFSFSICSSNSLFILLRGILSHLQGFTWHLSHQQQFWIWVGHERHINIIYLFIYNIIYFNSLFHTSSDKKGEPFSFYCWICWKVLVTDFIQNIGIYRIILDLVTAYL